MTKTNEEIARELAEKLSFPEMNTQVDLGNGTSIKTCGLGWGSSLEKNAEMIKQALDAKDSTFRATRCQALEDAYYAAQNVQTTFLQHKTYHVFPAYENLPDKSNKEAWLLRMANEMKAAIYALIDIEKDNLTGELPIGKLEEVLQQARTDALEEAAKYMEETFHPEYAEKIRGLSACSEAKNYGSGNK